MSSVTTEAQSDIFHRIGEPPRPSALRQEMSFLAYPFCQLSTRRYAGSESQNTIEYKDRNGIEITVTGGAKGLPDIQDFDLILYVVTVVNQLRNEGRSVGPNDTIEIDPHDFLSTAKWGRGGSYYKRLQDALDRLQTAQVKTNIFAEDFERITAEPLLAKYELERRKDASGRKSVRSIRLKMSEWLWNAVLNREHIKRISPEIFDISNPTAKKIYQVVDKQIGDSTQFEIGVANLKDRCGATCETKEFKRRIKQIAERGELPNFLIHFRKSRHSYGQVVVFSRKGASGTSQMR